MLSYDLAFDVYPPDDPAGKVSGTGVDARLVRLTLDDQLVDGEYLAELFGSGSGFVEIHVDNPDADYLQKRGYIQVIRMTGSLWLSEEPIGGFWLSRGFLKALSGSEQKGRVVRWEGEGPSDGLDRYVLGHTVYASGQTQRGDRTIPGKWAWNDEPLGAMLLRVLEEGFDHPDAFYNFFDWDFTRNEDTNGNDWESLSDYETPIGTSGLKLWADFLKQGLVAEVSPDLTIHAYRDLDEYRTDRHSATFAAGKVRFEAGVNIAADLLKRINPASQRTHVLYKDRIGDYQTIDVDEDDNPIDGVPYMTFRESTTTADDDAIVRMGKHFLSTLDRNVDVAKVRHLIGPGGIAGDEGYLPSPTGDYWLGDLVTIHSGTTEYDFNEQTIEVAAIRYFVQGNQWMVETELGAQYKSIQQQQVQSQIAQTVINQLSSVLLCQPLEVQDDPSEWIPGDVLIVSAEHGSNTIPTAASGFTAIGSGGSQATGPLGRRTFYKVLAGGETTLGSFGMATSGNLAWIILRGQDAVDFVGKIAGGGGNLSAVRYFALTAPLDGANSRILLFGSHANPVAAIGAPPGYTHLVTGTAGGTFPGPPQGIQISTAEVASLAQVDVSTGTVGNGYQSASIEIIADSPDSLRVIDYGVAANDGALPAEGVPGAALPGDGMEELVGTSVKAKRCDDTEHYHATGSDSPTADDDVEAGFRPGTIWVNDDGEAWIAFDVSAGAADWIAISGGGGGGAPTTADYLVGTAQGGLSAEIVVGTTPGGELGGTWASPTVDTTHSGSAHHTPNSVRKNSTGSTFTRSRLNLIEGSNVTLTVADDAGNDEVDVTIAAAGASGAPSTADYLVGTADAGLSGEIVVGTSPGGELGGSWASPTVDASHAGSDHLQPVRKNSTGSVFSRRRLNLIEGSNVTLTVADDAGDDEVDITINSSPGSSPFASGTSFPGSPANNDIFYRTDRDLLYFYDGTRWLTVQQFDLGVGWVEAAAALNATTTLARWPVRQDYGIWLERWSAVTFQSNATPGTNNMTVVLARVDNANTATTIASFTTSTDTQNTWQNHDQAIGAVLNSSALHLRTVATEAGSVTGFIIAESIIYRLIG